MCRFDLAHNQQLFSRFSFLFLLSVIFQVHSLTVSHTLSCCSVLGMCTGMCMCVLWGQEGMGRVKKRDAMQPTQRTRNQASKRPSFNQEHAHTNTDRRMHKHSKCNHGKRAASLLRTGS